MGRIRAAHYVDQNKMEQPGFPRHRIDEDGAAQGLGPQPEEDELA
jgi:hypothetical protein